MFYINGVKASKSEVRLLFERVLNGKDRIVETHTTKAGNLAIVTE